MPKILSLWSMPPSPDHCYLHINNLTYLPWIRFFGCLSHGWPIICQWEVQLYFTAKQWCERNELPIAGSLGICTNLAVLNKTSKCKVSWHMYLILINSNTILVIVWLMQNLNQKSGRKFELCIQLKRNLLTWCWLFDRPTTYMASLIYVGHTMNWI